MLTAMPRKAALIHATLALLMACAVCARAGAAAAAEAVWRCPTVDGAAVAYQSTPCSHGGHALSTSPPPSAEDREASARTAKREAGLARALARQRTQREANLPPAHASLSGPVRQVSVGQRQEAKSKTRGRSRNRTAEERAERAGQRRHDVFRAEVPGHPRKGSGTLQADAVSASPP